MIVYLSISLYPYLSITSLQWTVCPCSGVIFVRSHLSDYMIVYFSVSLFVNCFSPMDSLSLFRCNVCPKPLVRLYDCLFVYFFVSLFVNYFPPMDSLSLFRCNFCPKLFDRQSKLTKHEETHAKRQINQVNYLDRFFLCCQFSLSEIYIFLCKSSSSILFTRIYIFKNMARGERRGYREQEEAWERKI